MKHSSPQTDVMKAAYKILIKQLFESMSPTETRIGYLMPSAWVEVTIRNRRQKLWMMRFSGSMCCMGRNPVGHDTPYQLMRWSEVQQIHGGIQIVDAHRLTPSASESIPGMYCTAREMARQSTWLRLRQTPDSNPYAKYFALYSKRMGLQ